MYAYSPSNSGIETMWDSYPGDEWVDIIGFDDYFSYMGGDDEASRADAKANDLQRFTGLIEMIVTEAERRGKIPAITETGLEALRDSTWFTSFLLNAINANDVTRRMSYVLVWRNSNDATDRKEHFYAPYPGHASANDFLKFTQDPSIMLESGLPNMFDMPKK
jgi:mannan endo-1,4-beta-mannosidase